MKDITQFLREAVFYPCAGVDGAPVKFLAKRFSSFFCTDYSIDRAAFETACKENGFRGYRVRAIDDLVVDSVFHGSWADIGLDYQEGIARVPFDCADTFVAAAHFERLPDFAEEHGPLRFELMFARCEAIATFLSVFSRRGIAPRCLAYIRSGIGYGGNYQEFPLKLEQALRGNPAGLPEFMLYDEMGGDRGCGDFLSLVEDYEPIERRDHQTERYRVGNLTLAKLRTKNVERGR